MSLLNHRRNSQLKNKTKFNKINFKVFVHDPYFKEQLLEKYLKENFLEKLNFEYKKELDDETLNDVSCLCIVQHHTKTKFRLMEIYEKSLVPFIYDCQNNLERKIESKTLLDSLGS